MKHHGADRIAAMLLQMYLLDRALKCLAVVEFFRRPPPPAPSVWPSVTLVQPVTTGATDLRRNLASRLQTAYPGDVQHLVVCDASDQGSVQICREVFATTEGAQIVEIEGPSIASKTDKLEAGIGRAHGDILCFIDDDVALRPGALTMLVRHLLEPGAGAVFGLASYVWWRDVPSSLMSLFVNHNALLSYVPLVYLTDPFTVTGHCYALHRSTLKYTGTFGNMRDHIDDDHAMARRVRELGLRNVQTPMIYDVSNALPTMGAYAIQMKRWFVMPRQALLPFLTPREQAVSALGSLGNLLPGLLALVALTTRRAKAIRALAGSLIVGGGVHWMLERWYIQRRTPLRRWLLFPIMVLTTPFHIVWALLGDTTTEWRGRRLRIERGGRFTVEGDQRT